MAGIENDLGVMDGTDFNTGAGGGLRHGGRQRRGRRKQGSINNIRVLQTLRSQETPPTSGDRKPDDIRAVCV